MIVKNNPTAKDALFLSNHDNGRSAGFLLRNLQKEKMAAALYLLAPGNPFIYYGEEIGMTGSGKDENKRLPMLWSETDKTGIPVPPPNAAQTLEGVKGADEQIKDKTSLLNYYKEILIIKKKHPEIARGVMEPIDTGNQEIARIFCFLIKGKGWSSSQSVGRAAADQPPLAGWEEMFHFSLPRDKGRKTGTVRRYCHPSADVHYDHEMKQQ